MIVAVVGCGNVGANLLQYLVDVENVEKILAIGSRGADEKAKAAIMDVASYKPLQAHKIIASSNDSIAEADVIVITAGFKAKYSETSKEVMRKNLRIIDSILEGVKLKPTAILIVIAGPVDITTSYVQRKLNFPPEQVIGFGGDLDRNRLIYTLEGLSIDSAGVGVVGEHGHRTIPVYNPEEKYDEVSSKVRFFLADIGKLAGVKRNLATAPLLAKLIRSVTEDRGDVHYVSGYSPQHDLYITWPHRIWQRGILSVERLDLPPKAQSDFDALVREKKLEKGELEIEFEV